MRACSRSKPQPFTTLVHITHYASRNYTDHPQVNIHWTHCIENIFTVQDFEQIALALKNRVCPENFHCIEYISYHSGFWATLRLPRKTGFALNFSLYWNILYLSGFLSNLRLPWKTVYLENFHCIEYTVLHTFRIFEQLVLALKTECALKF